MWCLSPEKSRLLSLARCALQDLSPEEGARLLDLVAAAGGLTDAADSRSIAITRSAQGEKEIFAVDAYNAMMGRVGGDNPVLLGGDIVFIPEGKNLALVLGQVLRPGNYPLTDSNRVLELIAAAGALRPKLRQTG